MDEHAKGHAMHVVVRLGDINQQSVLSIIISFDVEVAVDPVFATPVFKVR